jgi:hypothetical protein
MVFEEGKRIPFVSAGIATQAGTSGPGGRGRARYDYVGGLVTSITGARCRAEIDSRRLIGSSQSAGAAGPARPIDRSSPVPYYYQLQEILKEEIERGRWGPGDMLPSEAEICALFGISRTAIRKALDVLESDG